MSVIDTGTRSTDPDTSRAAGRAAAEHAPVVRDVVARLVGLYGPLTHDELIDRYHRLMVVDPATPRASDSGIRTRLSELVRAGLVAVDGTEGVSAFGNRAKRWALTDVGRGLS